MTQKFQEIDFDEFRKICKGIGGRPHPLSSSGHLKIEIEDGKESLTFQRIILTQDIQFIDDELLRKIILKDCKLKNLRYDRCKIGSIILKKSKIDGDINLDDCIAKTILVDSTTLNGAINFTNDSKLTELVIQKKSKTNDISVTTQSKIENLSVINSIAANIVINDASSVNEIWIKDESEIKDFRIKNSHLGSVLFVTSMVNEIVSTYD